MLLQILLLLTSVSFAQVPIMQGFTNHRSAQFNIVLSKNIIPQFNVILDGAKTQIKPNKVITTNKEFLDYAIFKISFTKLKSNKKYKLRVLDQNNKIIDERNFITLKKNRFLPLIAIASCMDDHFAEQKNQWLDLSSFKPDMLLLIGDNVYVDKPIKDISENDIWKRYIQTRQTLELFKLKDLIPIVATWDDHDFGANNSDSSFKYKNTATEVFNAFYAQEPYDKQVIQGPGIATGLLLSDFKIFLMDDRSFNTPQSPWGAEQERWLFDQLTKSNNISLIVNGFQFFGGYHSFDSFEGKFKNSFELFKSGLTKVKSPFLFISGDRHLTELMEIPSSEVGKRTYEFTTSGIHAKTYPPPWDKSPNKRQIEGVALTMNYGLIKIKNIKTSLVDITAVGPNKKILYQRELRIK